MTPVPLEHNRFVWVDDDLIFGPTVAGGDFDESKHPRDEKGRFGEGDGGGTLAVGDIRPDPAATETELSDSVIAWQYWSEEYNARYAAEIMLGQDHPTVSDFSTVIQSTGNQTVMRALDAGELSGEMDLETQGAVDNAYNLLAGVRDAENDGLPLYRGVPLDPRQPGTAELAALKPGDTFDLSLASFSNDRNTAESYAIGMVGEPKIMFTFENGAKGVSDDSTEVEVHVGGRIIDSGSNIGNWEGGSWEQGHNDVVVGGRLEVVDVRPYVPEAVNPIPSKTMNEVVVRQVGVFDPDDGGKLIPVRERESVTASGKPRNRYRRAPFWEVFARGPHATVAGGDFDESKHPRDAHGRFGDAGGEAAEVTPELALLINDYTIMNMMSEQVHEAALQSKQVAPPLTRGLLLEPDDYAKVMEAMKPGETVELDVSSWSAEPGVGAEFASPFSPSMSGVADEETHGVILELEGGARGLNIEPYAEDMYKYQKEWLVGGKFRVTGIDQSERRIPEEEPVPVIKLVRA